MKGDLEVIKVLGSVLTAELTSVNQYFLHAEICENWKFLGLAGRIRKEAIDEMKHAEALIERVLYLDGMPDVQSYSPIRIGKDVPQMFTNDLALEQDAVKRLNDGIQVCTQRGDNGSRELLVSILQDEEEHVDWIEAQIHQLQTLGLQNYLTTVVGSPDPK